MNEIWDEAESGYQDKRSQSAFFTLPLEKTDKDSEELIHQWLLAELDFLIEDGRERNQKTMKNLSLWKGLQYRDEAKRRNPDSGADKKQAVEKIVQNHLYDLSKIRASKLLKYKPAVAILPTSEDWGDYISSKMTKMWLDHIWYVERFDGEKLPKFVRNVQPMGECYLFVDWDKDKGDVSKQYKQALEEARKNGNGKVPLLDENGGVQKDDNGNSIYVDSPIMNGDVSYRVQMSTDVFPQKEPRGEWDRVNYLFERLIMEVEEARLRWPKRADVIRSESKTSFYDYEKLESKQNAHLVEVWCFHHKRTASLNLGRKIYFTRDGILENKRFPFSHKKLPCVRLTDIDPPGELHGASFFELVKGTTGAHNNLTNMILRNQVFAGHPKWMLPAGSAKLDALGNAITVVQFKGPVAPQLVSANPTPREIFEFRNMLKEDFMLHADVGNTGRSEPPPGITAAVALQYLSEMENERWNETVLKYNEAILQLAILTVAVGGDYYDQDDERNIRMLGKNNAWMSVAFKGMHLQKDYDIRIQSSSALPEGKAARTEYLLYLNERFPEKVDGDAVLNMLDLAQSDKFISSATVSVRAAEAENEMLMDSTTAPRVKAPMDGEDHIEHWRIHVRQYREWGFKNTSPKEVQEALHDHILATEMEIFKKVMAFPEYAQMVAPIGAMGFPLLFKAKPTPDLSPPPVAPQAPAAPAPGGGPGPIGQSQADQPIQETPPAPVQAPGGPVNEPPAPLGDQLTGGPVPSLPTQLEGANAPEIEPIH